MLSSRPGSDPTTCLLAEGRRGGDSLLPTTMAATRRLWRRQPGGADDPTTRLSRRHGGEPRGTPPQPRRVAVARRHDMHPPRVPSADGTQTGRWDDPARALAAVLRYAGTGARSTREIRAFLARRGVAPSAARRILAECRVRGLLNDRACARLWAGHWARQGYAGATIRLKLAAKGLEGPVIAPLVESMMRASDDEARARLVAAQQRSLRSGRAGLVRRLAARGYEFDVIERVVRES